MPVFYRPKDDRYVASCERGHCTFGITFNTSDEAWAALDTHSCPTINGTSHYAEEVTMLLVEKMWEIIDGRYADLKSANDIDEQVFLKMQGALRGQAEYLQLFMSPYFETADDIVREVMKRHAAKQAGEPYETIGLGSRAYETPIFEGNDAYKEAKARKAAVVASAKASNAPAHKKMQTVEHNLSSDDISVIKYSMSSGMMDAIELAATYDTTVDVILFVTKGK